MDVRRPPPYCDETPRDHAPATLDKENAMTSVLLGNTTVTEERAAGRAGALADRLEAGAAALASFAGTLSDLEWNSRMPKDGRTIGVIVNHVASVYPVEINLAQAVANGEPVTGVTPGDIDQMNAAHARENA